jgi:hypothetical protein
LCSFLLRELAHATLACAVHDQLPHSRRAGHHRQAAGILADEGAGVEEIAAHLLLTDPAGDQRVVAQLRAAVERAQARGAPESAAASWHARFANRLGE